MLPPFQSQRIAVFSLSLGLLLPLVSLTACEKKAEEHTAPKGDAPKSGDTPSAKKDAQAAVKQEGTAKDAPPPVAAKPSTFRSVDPSKDSFTLGMKTKRLGFNGSGMVSGEVAGITASGTAGGLEGVEIELELVSGTITDSQVQSKDYGIIKIRSNFGSGADFQMTEDSIAKVRDALRAKKK